MGTLKITDEQIIDAGRRLESLKIVVSGYKLRRELGHIGKPERLLKVWEAAMQSTDIAEVKQSDTIPLPSEIQDSVNLLTGELVRHIENTIVQCNTIATQTADNRVASIIKEMKKRIASSLETDSEANSEIERCDNVIDELKSEIASITDKNAKLLNKSKRTTNQLRLA